MLKKSARRPTQPGSLVLDTGIELTAAGVVIMHFPPLVNNQEFFPSAFKLKTSGTVIYIDPVQFREPEAADFILITHKHPDHFSLEEIGKLCKPATCILGPGDVYKSVKKKLPNQTTILTTPGKIFRFGKLTLETVASYNRKSGLFTAHPQKKGYTGYVIGIEGIKIYHAGDTDYVEEMRRLENLTLALVPIAGGDLTMSTASAAEFVNNQKPLHVVPMHYTPGKGEETRFRSLVDKDIRVTIMDGQ